MDLQTREAHVLWRADSPQRIQRKRAKGWQMPGNTVYVGRPSKWGNPFTATLEADKAEAVEHFREWLNHPSRAKLRAEARVELRGKHLACWCAHGVACHADVWIEIANGEPS
jgi:hypothetical protein